MAARCFNDTCTVKTTESGNAINIDVQLKTNGGILCDNGLYVNLRRSVPEDIPTGRACADILQITTAGKLYALVPEGDHALTELAGTMRRIPNDGSAASTSSNRNVVNDTGCEAMLILMGQYQLNWKIADQDSSPPPNAGTKYNTLFKMTLLRDGVPVENQYAHVGGEKVAANGVHEFQKEWRDFIYIAPMAAGDSWYFTDEVIHLLDAVPGIRLNVTASVATASPDLSTGYRTFMNAIILPIGIA